MWTGDDRNDDTEVHFVCIPANSSEAVRELQFQPMTATSNAGQIGALQQDFLLEHLKSKGVFAGDSSTSIDTSLMSQPASLMASSSDSKENDAVPKVSEQTLQDLAKNTSHIETFSLVHPTESNQYTSTLIYLDEIGALKRLPLNPRASKIALQCGYDPAPQFYGDVYIGRRQHHRCLPFRLSDMDASAPWLQQATMSNLDYQLQQNKLTGRVGEEARQPAVAGTEAPAVETSAASAINHFTWTQTEQELEIQVKLPDDLPKRDIGVDFRSTAIRIFDKRVGKTGTTSEKDTLDIAISLLERVDVDGCTWTIETKGPEKTLVVSMEKMEEAFWPRIRD